MADRLDDRDLIVLAAAATLVALELLAQAAIAAGALVAQLLDALASHGQQPQQTAYAPRSARSTAPAPFAGLKVLELRQLARRGGAPSWWSMNRAACERFLLAAGGAA